MWFSLRDPILRWMEVLAVSKLQLLKALLSLRYILQQHVMYGIAADQRETGTEDYASIRQIRVSLTSSDNTTTLAYAPNYPLIEWQQLYFQTLARA